MFAHPNVERGPTAADSRRRSTGQCGSLRYNWAIASDVIGRIYLRRFRVSAASAQRGCFLGSVQPLQSLRAYSVALREIHDALTHPIDHRRVFTVLKAPLRRIGWHRNYLLHAAIEPESGACLSGANADPSRLPGSG